MSRSAISTFTTVPFGEGDAAVASGPSPLRVSLAARLAPAPASPREPAPAPPKRALTMPARPAATPSFVPPVSMREAKERRDKTAVILAGLTAELAGLSRKHPQRADVLRAMVPHEAERRALRIWIHDNRDNPDSGIRNPYQTALIQGLIDAIDRAADAGFKFTDEELDNMNRASWWLHKDDPEVQK